MITREVGKRLKWLSLALCVALIVTLFPACGNKNPSKSSSESLPQSSIKDLPVNSNTLYKKHTVTPDTKIYFSSASSDGHYIYLYGTNLDSGDKVLYSLELSTYKLSQVNYTANSSISTIAASGTGSVYLLEYEEMEDSGELEYVLLQISTEGERISEIRLKEAVEHDQTAITGILPIENYVLVSLMNSIVVIDFEGKIIKTFDYEGNAKQVVWSADGTVLICGRENSSYIVEELSLDSMRLSDKFTIDGQFTRVYDGYHGDGIYLSDGNSIYSVDYKLNTKRSLINLSINNINTSNFICIDSETFFSLQDGIPAIWEPQNEETERTVFLKLAAYNIDWMLRDAVIDFNSQSDKFIIEVVDYAQYDAASDLSGLTVLNTEMISGRHPDIFDFSALQAGTYIANGFIEDINPYIEADLDLDYSDFVNGVIDCLIDEDGHLYEMVPGFRVTTLAGNTETLPSSGTWTPEQFCEFAASHSGETNILPENISREAFLSYILAFSGDSFIDYETAKCSFDTPAFKALLEFAVSLKPENELDNETRTRIFLEEYSQILTGKQLLTIVNTGLPVDDYITLEAVFGGAVSYIGFPTESGTGCGMSPIMRLGMSSSSEDKDGVWQFFKYLLQKYQNEIINKQYIPVMEDVFAKNLEAKISHYTENPLKFATFSDGVELVVECSIPSSGTVKSIYDLIGRMDRISESDPVIYDIILEQASMYFSGQRSIDDVVNMIQSRAQLYLGEQFS